MRKDNLSQEEKELQKIELLNEFQMEELEQRFEMTAAVDASVDDHEPGSVTIVSWTIF